MKLKKLMTRKQVAAVFGVSAEAVRLWQLKGAITPINSPGERTVRYRGEDIARFLELKSSQPMTAT